MIAGGVATRELCKEYHSSAAGSPAAGSVLILERHDEVWEDRVASEDESNYATGGGANAHLRLSSDRVARRCISPRPHRSHRYRACHFRGDSHFGFLRRVSAVEQHRRKNAPADDTDVRTGTLAGERLATSRPRVCQNFSPLLVSGIRSLATKDGSRRHRRASLRTDSRGEGLG